MPSRPALGVILAFWLSVSGFAVYRDVWPLVHTSAPPQLSVELIDEARQNQPVSWSLYHGNKRVGRLTTRIQRAADDSYWVTHDYQQLEFDVSHVQVNVPKLTTSTRVGRSGELREQTLVGKLELQLGTEKLVGEANVRGEVIDGVFVGHCEVRSPLLNVNRALDPIPVPAGQALNPLQVTHRLTGLKPGQQWVVYEVDPLGEALATLFASEVRKVGFSPPERKRDRIIARISSSPESLTWQQQEHACWVIEYRSIEARAKTWVRVGDGLVIRQEAYGMGERLAIERDE